ncbi:hypothetical protein BDV95DRAFT_588950 [Massariosphaeria phaeospora]|uniref:Neprosin PEP catalytic domain-containing protein n=1 Tax=Massariosphaeria phaeospora TaxID=100035 RepID=A0A7C8IMH1_9PLEO|nr:hypothetical protein BDV95DRAFT_588950 [Massariosphaeria phaeospora]
MSTWPSAQQATIRHSPGVVSQFCLSSAIPIDGPTPAVLSSPQGQKRRDLNIVKTTTNSDGSVIDWIPLDSQVPDGKIASPPPLPAEIFSTSNQTSERPWAMLQAEGAETGPEGTVPVLRQSVSLSNVKTAHQLQMTKAPPVDPWHVPEVETAAVGDHWYASSAQRVNNHGGSASFSLYKAWTESNSDFSLLQSAVIRYDVPKPGDNNQRVSQTVEAGWINYPQQIAAPHLFTFFTTDGYSTIADNKGGWNRDVRGWVQVDSQIFPGTSFAPLSTPGGAQYDIQIRWLLDGGNWWLFVLDRWIGYYPASLFGADTDPNRSLQTESGQINFYGEIYDSHPQHTRTDMGSGNWPDAGWTQSAYIRNIVYTDTGRSDQKYDGGGGIIVSDNNRYRMRADFQSQGSWGSHMYLGGPGAGGVVNG